MIVQRHGIKFDAEALAELCRRYDVRELSLFGSVLRDDFRDDSDVDILVEFKPGAPIGLFEFSDLKYALADLLGRDVDLVEKPGLKAVIRDDVLASAEVLFAD
ncbi:nucleotidyltransferase [soil metagenome]